MLHLTLTASSDFSGGRHAWVQPPALLALPASWRMRVGRRGRVHVISHVEEGYIQLGTRPGTDPAEGSSGLPVLQQGARQMRGLSQHWPKLQ